MTWYRTGTVSVTNGSAVVTGAGTAFVANVIAAQGLLTSAGLFEILAINSDTQLTLAQPWAGGTANGIAYAIAPTDGPTFDLYNRVSLLINTFASVRDGIGQGLLPDGTASAPAMRFASDQDTGWFRAGENTIGFAVGGVAVLLVGASTVLNGNTFGPGYIELGSSGTGNRYAYIDAHGDDTYADYGYRLQRGPSANGSTTLSHRGTGTLGLTALEAAPIVFTTNSIDRVVVQPEGHLRPASDNVYQLGTSVCRWATIYAASGTIQTSDARAKTWRGGLTEAELAASRAIARLIGVYQWNDAIAAKGEDGARLHTGVEAQAVVAAMQAAGLNPMRYGFVCYDEWAAVAAQPAVPEERAEDGRLLHPAIREVPARPAGNRYGVRYEELAMFVAAGEGAAQEQRLAVIEARLAALEAKLEARLAALEAKLAA